MRAHARTLSLSKVIAQYYVHSQQQNISKEFSHGTFPFLKIALY
jgi:hypothetical protein